METPITSVTESLLGATVRNIHWTPTYTVTEIFHTMGQPHVALTSDRAMKSNMGTVVTYVGQDQFMKLFVQVTPGKDI